MTHPRIVLHIGLPKTGTTSLQNNLFVPHDAWSFIGKPLVHTNQRMRRFIRPIVEQDPAAYERGLEDYRSQVIEPCLREAGQLLLVSEEEFSTGTVRTRVDRFTIARRLHGIFPDARVLLTIRNQLDVLPSIYGQLLNMGFMGRQSFSTWIAAELGKEGNQSRLHLFDYAELIVLYQSLFGAEQLKVMLFEDLRADNDRFISEMCRFMQVDVEPALARYQENQGRNTNPRITRRHARWRLLTQALPFVPWEGILIKSRLRPRFSRFLERGKPIETEFTAEQRASLIDFYRPKNRRAAELLGVDLGAHGYPV